MKNILDYESEEMPECKNCGSDLDWADIVLVDGQNPNSKEFKGACQCQCCEKVYPSLEAAGFGKEGD